MVRVAEGPEVLMRGFSGGDNCSITGAFLYF